MILSVKHVQFPSPLKDVASLPTRLNMYVIRQVGNHQLRNRQVHNQQAVIFPTGLYGINLYIIYFSLQPSKIYLLGELNLEYKTIKKIYFYKFKIHPSISKCSICGSSLPTSPFASIKLPKENQKHIIKMLNVKRCH